MAGEVAVDSSRKQDLSKPIGQERTRQRLPTVEQEQRGQAQARRVHMGAFPRSICTKEPLQKGSVLEALVRTHIQVGERLESTAKSEMDRGIASVKLAKLGTVNSAEQRNPK